jgi:hypothetical protein
MNQLQLSSIRLIGWGATTGGCNSAVALYARTNKHKVYSGLGWVSRTQVKWLQNLLEMTPRYFYRICTCIFLLCCVN